MRPAKELTPAVKVGERVRATCGESVIVGTVKNLYPEGLSIYVDGDYHRYYMADGVWTVEVLAPPIPDVRGTVVIDRYDSAWQRWASGWQAIGGDTSDMRTLPQLMVGFGPLTVLWTPEATP